MDAERHDDGSLQGPLHDDAGGRYELRLYVGGNNARSLAAIGNIKTILEAYVPGRYGLEVVDIFQNPGLRERDQVLALPTLVKCAPGPARRIIGDLSDTARVLTDLGLADGPPVSAVRPHVS
jgi:circadian clock protein KaiB